MTCVANPPSWPFSIVRLLQLHSGSCGNDLQTRTSRAVSFVTPLDLSTSGRIVLPRSNGRWHGWLGRCSTERVQLRFKDRSTTTRQPCPMPSRDNYPLCRLDTAPFGHRKGLLNTKARNTLTPRHLITTYAQGKISFRTHSPRGRFAHSRHPLSWSRPLLTTLPRLDGVSRAE